MHPKISLWKVDVLDQDVVDDELPIYDPVSQPQEPVMDFVILILIPDSVLQSIMYPHLLSELRYYHIIELCTYVYYVVVFDNTVGTVHLYLLQR